MESFDPHTLALGLVWYVVFLFSTTCHEAAHALAAKLGGDMTAYEGGQVTLDPLPHIRREPFGMVLVPLITFLTQGWMIGWASTPYDPHWAQRHHRRAALMSLAGPSANLLLAALSAVAIRIGLSTGYFTPGRFSFAELVQGADGGVNTLAMFLSVSFALNLLLGLFNLLPVPPMDGSSVVTVVMSRELTLKWLRLIHQPILSIIGLLLAWRLFGDLFRPVFSLAVDILYAGLGVL